MKHRLWYKTWTNEYMEGLPVGNGRIAAMMLGQPDSTRIALNHEWMWRGENRGRTFPDMSDHLPEIRQALLDGDFLLGTTLANDYLGGLGGVSGQRNRVDPYQPVGDISIETNAEDVRDYMRTLDLDTGLTEVSFTTEAGRIREALFVSAADGCAVLRVTSERPADFCIRLTRREDPRCTIAYTVADNALTMQGHFTDGISFAAECRAWTDGSLSVTDAVRVCGATEITLLVQIGTDAKGGKPTDEMSFPDTHDFDALLARHIPCFARCKGDARLDVDLPDSDDIPTDERIVRFRAGEDPTLPLLYFEYGRYLMASGSSGELPLNLQGKWNEDLQPPWESDYHLDVNLQMCYWCAETLGMASAANTLFNLIERYVPYGREMAKNLYGCRGITFCIQTDVWGRVTPEAKGWSVWIGAAPWLGQHMFMHWRHTKDLDFLRDRCYPYLRECAAFYEDYVLEKDGELWIVPSQSPENRFEGTGGWPVSIGYNSAMDIELAVELLNAAIESAQILGVDEDKVRVWSDLLARLPKLTVDSIGRLNEWDCERREVEPGHRHLSHLYGLYPAQLFEPGSAEWIAAERSLDDRLSHGGGHTGWSRSWVACLMARLGRAEDAWQHFIELIGSFATVSLLDLCPPRIFQIDGNMGGTACVCEMLMQSRRGELRLLPALPQAWKSGRVENFCAQDSVTVSFDWKDGALASCTLLSAEDTTLRIVSGSFDTTVQLKANEPCHLTA